MPIDPLRLPCRKWRANYASPVTRTQGSNEALLSIDDRLAPDRRDPIVNFKRSMQDMAPTKILRRNFSRRVRRDSTVRARASLRCGTTFSCLSFGLERLYSFPLAHLRHILYPPP
jgi:hypothetical protein